jgi:hypothetical protein
MKWPLLAVFRPVGGGFLFLGIGFALVNPQVRMGPHSIIPLPWIAPIGIGSMGAFFSTPPCYPPTEQMGIDFAPQPR